MDKADWFQCAAWMALKWPNQPLDSQTTEAWYSTMNRFEIAAVGAAIDRLAERMPMRPALSELIAETKAYLAGQTVTALPPHIPRTSGYGPAWLAIGKAVREKRLPRAEVDALAEKHKRWFLDHGEDATATAEMVKEAQALADKVGGPVPVVEALSAARGRYSDAHKRRYMASVDAYEAQKQQEKEPAG